MKGHGRNMKAGAIAVGLCLFVGLLLIPRTHVVLASPDEGQPAAQPPRTDTKDVATLATLKSIIESTASLKEQLKSKEKELKVASTEDQKLQIAAEIKELSQRLHGLENDFQQIASGVGPETFDPEGKEQFDLKQEMQDLIEPIIQELKDATARPREIERLRNMVSYYKARVPIAKEAIQNVQVLLARAKEDKLKKELAELEKSLEVREQQISNQLSIYQYQLNGKLDEKASFWGSVQNLLLVFFRSRGKNMVLAMVAFISVFLLLRYVHIYLYKTYPFLQSAKRSFYLRLIEVMYHGATVLGATLAALIVLYVSGDWVLLGLALIFIFGLAWTAKQTLPLVYEQGKLLLNLGSVRENERVVYNGLPWRVQALNVYSQLVNPELKGGIMKMRLSELVGLSSRPFEPDEPWFPCKEHDWVILADGTRGKVVTQTPEMVQLVLLGGSRKTYTTEDFLKQSPTNISTNFRIRVTFGLDYQHQATITTEIPTTLKEILMERLGAAGYLEDIINLKVEFKEAGASSLDLAILADFSGRVAKDYERLTRAIQRVAVDACNTYGWVIPFTQITLHTPNVPQDDQGRPHSE